MASAIREVVGEAPVRQGKVKLDVPPLVENGNAVSLTVSVESPMTESEHVKSIHIFNGNNPIERDDLLSRSARRTRTKFQAGFGLPILKRW